MGVPQRQVGKHGLQRRKTTGSLGRVRVGGLKCAGNRSTHAWRIHVQRNDVYPRNQNKFGDFFPSKIVAPLPSAHRSSYHELDLIQEMRVESSGSSQDGDAKTAGAGLVFKTNARPDGSHSSALVMVAAPRGKSERAVVIPIDYVDL